MELNLGLILILHYVQETPHITITQLRQIPGITSWFASIKSITNACHRMVSANLLTSANVRTKDLRNGRSYEIAEGGKQILMEIKQQLGIEPSETEPRLSMTKNKENVTTSLETIINQWIGKCNLEQLLGQDQIQSLIRAIQHLI